MTDTPSNTAVVPTTTKRGAGRPRVHSSTWEQVTQLASLGYSMADIARHMNLSESLAFGSGSGRIHASKKPMTLASMISLTWPPRPSGNSSWRRIWAQFASCCAINLSGRQAARQRLPSSTKCRCPRSTGMCRSLRRTRRRYWTGRILTPRDAIEAEFDLVEAMG